LDTLMFFGISYLTKKSLIFLAHELIPLIWITH
jgi:hypothetical protein